MQARTFTRFFLLPFSTILNELLLLIIIQKLEIHLFAIALENTLQSTSVSNQADVNAKFVQFLFSNYPPTQIYCYLTSSVTRKVIKFNKSKDATR